MACAPATPLGGHVPEAILPCDVIGPVLRFSSCTIGWQASDKSKGMVKLQRPPPSSTSFGRATFCLSSLSLRARPPAKTSRSTSPSASVSGSVRLNSAAAAAADASSFLAPSTAERKKRKREFAPGKNGLSGVKRSPSSSPPPPSPQSRTTEDAGQWPVRCFASTRARSFRPARTRSIGRALVVRAHGRRKSQESGRDRENPVSLAAAFPPPLPTVSAKRLVCCVQHRMDGRGRGRRG